MSDNKKTDSSLSAISVSVSNMAKALSSTLIPKFDVNALLKQYSDIGKQLAISLKSLYGIVNSDFFKSIRKNIKAFYDKTLIDRLQVMGSLEWCCVDERVDLSKRYKSIDKKESTLSELVIEKLNKDKYTPYEIDRYIGSFFNQNIISDIEAETIKIIDEEDAKKLKKAMIDYRGRRYLESAVIIAGLIDAQSIKQELFDVSQGKYHEDNTDKNNIPNISQGWRAFHIVFRNNFSKYFDDEHFNGNGKKETREKGMNEFLNSIQGNMPDDDTMISVVALSLCLLNFFDDSEWKNYPDNKPIGINRHWLMHGMYDVDDITRYDCIKLLLMLNQISKLYSKLQNGEL